MNQPPHKPAQDPRERRRYVSYCKKTAFVFTVLFLLQIPINYAIDPYDIYCVSTSRNFNQDKTRRPPRTSVPFRTARLQENALIFGSSRVLPIDCWAYFAADPGIKWRNLWINMANIHEVSRALVQAVASQPIHTVVVGLDFFGFNAMTIPSGFFQDITYARQIDESGNPWRLLGEACVILSPATTRDSLMTWLDNLGATGLVSGLLHRSIRNAGQTPQRDETLQAAYVPKHAQVARVTEALELAGRLTRDYALANPRTGVDTIADLRAIIESCVRHKTALYLFTTPEQARLLDSYVAIGSWPDYVRWLRTITAVVDEAKRRHPDAVIRFHSFSGYTAVATASPPERHFEDLVHYTTQTGQQMTDILFGRTPPPADDPAFGIPLGPDTIDAVVTAFESQAGTLARQ